MFDKTINDLRGQGLITQDDVVVVCMDNITKSALLFGAIGAAIASSKAGRYILATNRESVRLFDVEKKTGRYLGTCSTFRMDEITEAVAKGSLGGVGIVLKTTSGKYAYTTNNKFEGHRQKEQVARLKEFFNTPATRPRARSRV